MDAIVLTNYYEEEFPEISISLKEEFSPQENINFYFKKYRKARDGKEKIKEQIRLTNEAIKELDDRIAVVQNLEGDELVLYQNENRKDVGHAKKRYRSISVNEDWEIIIGRTSTENDFITTRLARAWDWWFHTRVFKGTHVVLRNFSKKQLPDDLRLICCRLAAYFSKAKKSTNVPVDYTEIRYVRKPRKSPPGYVIYKEQKTLYVDPLSMRDAVADVEKLYGRKEKN